MEYNEPEEKSLNETELDWEELVSSRENIVLVSWLHFATCAFLHKQNFSFDMIIGMLNQVTMSRT